MKLLHANYHKVQGFHMKHQTETNILDRVLDYYVQFQNGAQGHALKREDEYYYWQENINLGKIQTMA